jgi:hypothetical protein
MSVQEPLQQTCPDLHALSQDPQFPGSVWVFTHSEPQNTSPLGQWQVPFLQLAAEGQQTPVLPEVQRLVPAGHRVQSPGEGGAPILLPPLHIPW